jgi:hypothetical protein
MGRSRGGLTTKIHALVDSEGLPIVLKLTEGQAHDGRSAADMLETVTQGTILLADRAYDSNLLREPGGARRLGQCQSHATSLGPAGFQPVPLSLSQSRRALLQQAQTLPSRRHAI